jgi:hypothetical protein
MATLRFVKATDTGSDWIGLCALGTFLLLVILLLAWRVRFAFKKNEPAIFTAREEMILARQKQALAVFFVAFGILLISIWLHIPVRDSWIGWVFFVVACLTLGYVGLSILISNVFWGRHYSGPYKGDGAKVAGCSVLILLAVLTLDWWLQLLAFLAR